jgi:hypothetical protein
MSCEPESSVVPFCRSPLGDLHIRRLPGMRVQVVKPAAARLPAAVCPLSALHLHQHEDCSPWIVSPDEGIEEVYDLVLVQALPAATRRGSGIGNPVVHRPLCAGEQNLTIRQCGLKVARHVESTTISLLAVSCRPTFFTSLTERQPLNAQGIFAFLARRGQTGSPGATFTRRHGWIPPQLCQPGAYCV